MNRATTLQPRRVLCVIEHAHRDLDVAEAACHGRFTDPLGRATADVVDVQAHDERYRDRRADREDAPCALGECVDDHVAEPSQRDHDDEEDGDRRDDPQRRPQLVARDLGQGAAATARA